MPSIYRPALLRFRFLTAMLVIAMTTSLPVHAAQPGREVIGQWKFTSVLDGVEITSIDEKQAKRLLGKVMTIRKEGTRFETESCGAPGFESKQVETKGYVRQEAQISATKLGLPNPVVVVDIGCTQVFIKKPDHAVIFWDGFFFNAQRIRPSKEPRR